MGHIENGWECRFLPIFPFYQANTNRQASAHVPLMRIQTSVQTHPTAFLPFEKPKNPLIHHCSLLSQPSHLPQICTRLLRQSQNETTHPSQLRL